MGEDLSKSITSSLVVVTTKKGMVHILIGVVVAQGACRRSCRGKSVESLLDRKEQMEQFPEERGVLRAQASHSSQVPRFLPVIAGLGQLSLTRKEISSLVRKGCHGHIPL